MAGYSGTTLPKKLGIKEGHRVLLLGAPENFEKELVELPAGVRFVKSAATADVDEGLVRAIGLSTGLVDNKVCAIDETWSGLRFVVRLTDRPGWAKRRRA